MLMGGVALTPYPHPVVTPIPTPRRIDVTGFRMKRGGRCVVKLVCGVGCYPVY